MSEWKECNLGGVITLRRGHDLPERKRSVGEYPVFSSSGITGYHSECKIPESGVITGRYGTIGKVFFAESAHWPLNTTLYVEDFKGNDKKFIYYFLKTLDWDSFADIASAVPGINRNHVHLANVSIPSEVTEQQDIAEILSSLDDKIDLLTRQNVTLEALAQTYFRQWFVEEASDEWKVGKAEDYFEIGIGKTPPRQEHQWFSDDSNDVVWVSIADMGKSGLFIGDSSEYLTEKAIKQFNIRRVPKGAILLSFKLTVGRLAIALCELTTNEAIAHFKYKNEYEKEYLYCYLKAFDYYSLGSTSSIATAVNSKIIKAMTFIMPDVETLKRFHELTAPLFEKIESNACQIQTLQKFRDTLLPKLINGEVKVNA